MFSSIYYCNIIGSSFMVDGKGSFSNAQVASHCLLDVNLHLHVAKRALMFLFHELVSYLKSGYPINMYCYSGSPK